MLKLLLVCATVIIPVVVVFAHDADERKTAWIEGFVIYVAVAVVSLVSAGSDYSKEGQFLSNLASEEKSKNVSLTVIFKVLQGFKFNFISYSNLINYSML
jgi:multisubunit Na+/H+ antiporter MnhB subunit